MPTRHVRAALRRSWCRAPGTARAPPDHRERDGHALTRRRAPPVDVVDAAALRHQHARLGHAPPARGTRGCPCGSARASARSCAAQPGRLQEVHAQVHGRDRLVVAQRRPGGHAARRVDERREHAAVQRGPPRRRRRAPRARAAPARPGRRPTDSPRMPSRRLKGIMCLHDAQDLLGRDRRHAVDDASGSARAIIADPSRPAGRRRGAPRAARGPSRAGRGWRR